MGYKTGKSHQKKKIKLKCTSVLFTLHQKQKNLFVIPIFHFHSAREHFLFRISEFKKFYFLFSFRCCIIFLFLCCVRLLFHLKRLKFYFLFIICVVRLYRGLYSHLFKSHIDFRVCFQFV